MDKVEARELLKEFLLGLQSQSHLELRKLVGDPVCVEIRGQSGANYQIEYEALWDSKTGADLRVLASIDDGGFFSAMFPICSDFIITPEDEVLS
jgi:hypothetical protein